VRALSRTWAVWLLLCASCLACKRRHVDIPEPKPERPAASRFGEPALVSCQSPLPELLQPATSQVDRGIAEFLAGLAAAGVSMRHEQLPLAECPAEARIGCFGEAETIYCSEVALARLVFGLGLLHERVSTRVASELRDHAFVEAFARLGKVDARGPTVLFAIDQRAFPDWWDNHPRRFAAGPELRGLASQIERLDLDSQLSPHIYTAARDLVFAFIFGHEAHHALSGCPLEASSEVERSGDFRRLAGLQRAERFCPNPASVVELGADICGLRHVEHILKSRADALDPDSLHLAAELALEILSSALYQGLQAPPDYSPEQEPDGYLQPILRIVALQRTIVAGLDGVDQLGPCNDSWWVFLQEFHRSRTCVYGGLSDGDVVLTAEWHDSIFAQSSIDGRYCLDPWSPLPEETRILDPDPTVDIEVVAVRGERKQQSVPNPVTVDEMLSRPVLHARLSRCLPAGERKLSVSLRYDHQGRLDRVFGPDQQVCACIEDALSGVGFGDSIFYAPVDPEQAHHEPGYFIELDLRRD